jgi:hypothetical protein
MTAWIFSGPSLRPADREGVPDLVWRPPVAQGDVLAAVEEGASILGIVDGYFEGEPAVLHKEILWAMDRGAVVLGAASMGALRAAELHVYGMRGVGRIFEAYRDERLVDDDDVALIHGPAEAGWAPVTEAMVNVGATLDAAVAAGVLTKHEADRIALAAKAIFYKERTWKLILEAAARAGAPPSETFAAWLGTGAVDQKRSDAQELVRQMRALPGRRPAPDERSWIYEQTEIFDRVASLVTGEAAVSDHEKDVLGELRLEPALHAALRERALLHGLASREAERRGRRASDREQRAARAALAERHGLFSGAARRAWQERNAAGPADLDRLAGSDALLQGLASERPRGQAARLLDELRRQGHYPRLADRARDKRLAVERAGADGATPQDMAMTPAMLRLWFFEKRLGVAMPDDWQAWLASAGFAGVDDFHHSLLCEFVYLARRSEDRSE